MILFYSKLKARAIVTSNKASRWHALQSFEAAHHTRLVMPRSRNVEKKKKNCWHHSPLTTRPQDRGTGKGRSLCGLAAFFGDNVFAGKPPRWHFSGCVRRWLSLPERANKSSSPLFLRILEGSAHDRVTRCSRVRVSQAGSQQNQQSTFSFGSSTGVKS